MKYNERQYTLNYADCNVKDTTGKLLGLEVYMVYSYNVFVHVIFGIQISDREFIFCLDSRVQKTFKLTTAASVAWQLSLEVALGSH